MSQQTSEVRPRSIGEGFVGCKTGETAREGTGVGRGGSQMFRGRTTVMSIPTLPLEGCGYLGV